MKLTNQVIYFEQIPDTPLGHIAVASTTTGILAIEIGIEDLHEWSRRLNIPDVEFVFTPGPFPVVSQFKAYFDGNLQKFDLPFDLQACTPFQRRVLESVLAIPYGETRTYAQIAEQIGRPGAYRAVGRANATNPLAIAIPCHRLVGKDGSLRGYGAPGGIQTKAWLLAFENQSSISMEGIIQTTN